MAIIQVGPGDNVQNAINSASSNDTIEFVASTTGGSSTINAGGSITVNKSGLTFTTRGTDRITLQMDGSSSSEAHSRILADGVSFIANVPNTPSSNGSLLLTGLRMRIGVYANDALFKDVALTNGGTNFGFSIGWTGNATPAYRTEINHCRVYNVGRYSSGSSPSHCVYAEYAEDLWIHNSWMWIADDRIIQMFPYCKNGLFENNVFALGSEGIHGGNGQQDLDACDEPSGNIFRRNIIYNNDNNVSEYWGFDSCGGPSQVGILGDVDNNVIWPDNRWNNIESPTGWRFVLGANTYSGNNPTPDVHFILEDPQFVNASSGDFTLVNKSISDYGPYDYNQNTLLSLRPNLSGSVPRNASLSDIQNPNDLAGWSGLQIHPNGWNGTTPQDGFQLVQNPDSALSSERSYKFTVAPGDDVGSSSGERAEIHTHWNNANSGANNLNFATPGETHYIFAEWMIDGINDDGLEAINTNSSCVILQIHGNNGGKEASDEAYNIHFDNKSGYRLRWQQQPDASGGGWGSIATFGSTPPTRKRIQVRFQVDMSTGTSYMSGEYRIVDWGTPRGEEGNWLPWANDPGSVSWTIGNKDGDDEQYLKSGGYFTGNVRPGYVGVLYTNYLTIATSEVTRDAFISTIGSGTGGGGGGTDPGGGDPDPIPSIYFGQDSLPPDDFKSIDSNSARACLYTIPAGKGIDYLEFYITDFGASSIQNAYAAIWDENGTLISASNPRDLTAPDSEGWKRFSFPDVVVPDELNDTNIYLGLVAGSRPNSTIQYGEVNSNNPTVVITGITYDPLNPVNLTSLTPVRTTEMNVRTELIDGVISPGELLPPNSFAIDSIQDHISGGRIVGKQLSLNATWPDDPNRQKSVIARHFLNPPTSNRDPYIDSVIVNEITGSTWNPGAVNVFDSIAEPTTWEVTIDNATEVERVEFFIDNTLVRTEFLAPYEVSGGGVYDFAQYGQGSHEAKAIVYNVDGVRTLTLISYFNNTSPLDDYPRPIYNPDGSVTFRGYTWTVADKRETGDGIITESGVWIDNRGTNNPCPYDLRGTNILVTGGRRSWIGMRSANQHLVGVHLESSGVAGDSIRPDGPNQSVIDCTFDDMPLLSTNPTSHSDYIQPFPGLNQTDFHVVGNAFGIHHHRCMILGDNMVFDGLICAHNTCRGRDYSETIPWYDYQFGEASSYVGAIYFNNLTEGVPSIYNGPVLPES